MISFDQIKEQDAAIDAIRTAYVQDRLPHGMIYAGPVGVGKGMTASAPTALFLCDKPRKADACGTCTSCLLMQAGTHPDFHLVYRQLTWLEKEDAVARDLSVEIVRTYLIGPANLKSAMLRGKVFVVEDAELMNPHAQNALLKTLEEPAQRTLIILMTDQPAELLPTVRSRCQLVNFAPLSEEFVSRELQARGISRQDAAAAASLSGGSLGLAIQWLKDGVVDRGRELHDRLNRIISGQVDQDLPEWFKRTSEAYAEKIMDEGRMKSKDQATRAGLLLCLRLAADHLRRKLSAVEPGQLEPICAAVDTLARAEEMVHGNVTISLIFQQVAVTLERLFGRDGAMARV